MMDERREAIAVKVAAGSLHYVPGYTAHRIVNTVDMQLIVGACWPADAGHDYKTLAETASSGSADGSFAFLPALSGSRLLFSYRSRFHIPRLPRISRIPETTAQNDHQHDGRNDPYDVLHFHSPQTINCVPFQC